MISFLIPFRTDEGPRQQRMEWTTSRIKVLFPEAEICVGDCDEGPFNRSQAINRAAAQATGEVFCITDADTFWNKDLIEMGLEYLELYDWVIPYTSVLHSDPATGAKIMEDSVGVYMNRGYGDWEHIIDASTDGPKVSPPVGGVTILRAEDFHFVHGFDEQFISWGGEDLAFCQTMNNLVGPYHRVPGDVYHIWHPRVPDFSDPGWASNSQRQALYLRSNEEAIRQLRDEEFQARSG